MGWVGVKVEVNVTYHSNAAIHQRSGGWVGHTVPEPDVR